MKYFLFFLIAALSINKTVSAASNETFKISGTTNKGDTVKVFLWDHYVGKHKASFYERKTEMHSAEDGSFSFRYDSIKGPVYFTITFRSGHNLYVAQNYIAMPGDSVFVRQQEYKSLSFAGKGSERMNCWYTMDSVGTKVLRYFGKQVYTHGYFKTNQHLLFLQTEFNKLDSFTKRKTEVLNGFRSALAKEEYQLLKADLLGSTSASQFINHKIAVSNAKLIQDKDSMQNIITDLNAYFKANASLPKTTIPDNILSSSRWYVEALTNLINVEATLSPGKSGYKMIYERYHGELRDHILTVYLLEFQGGTSPVESEIMDSLAFLQTDYCRQILQTFLTKYLRGAPAYDFALEDVSGRMRKLSEFRGKKIVIDFWYTGCTGCVQLYKGGLKEVEEFYQKDGSIIFLSIANDSDRSIWKKSIYSGLYTSPSVINLFTGRPDEKHPVLKQYNITFHPTLVIVDENGKIAYNGDAPKNKELLIQLIQSN